MLNKYTTEKIKCQQLFKVFSIFCIADYSVLSFRLFSPLFQDFNKIINSLKDCVGDFIQVFIFLQRS